LAGGDGGHKGEGGHVPVSRHCSLLYHILRAKNLVIVIIIYLLIKQREDKMVAKFVPSLVSATNTSLLGGEVMAI